MFDYLKSGISWFFKQHDLQSISSLAGIIVSVIVVIQTFGQIFGWLWRVQQFTTSGSNFTISPSPSSSDGWKSCDSKGQNTLCIPGNYYPRYLHPPSLGQKFSKWFFRVKAWFYKLASRSTPFIQRPKYYFSNYNSAGLDPVFDILFQNKTGTDIIITGLGIEICSVAHVMQAMGSPPARKIEFLEKYILQIPDINQEMRDRGLWNDPRVLETQSVNRKISVEKFQDMVSIERDGTFRYELWLNGYVKNIPTESIIRLWLQSNESSVFWSPYIRLTHISYEN
ncbi:hypothetical protein L3556_03195 [Candidatus Synechococcus calcipolaris G9]|uniref:Isochorismatase-like domain-containing protein n=1 Tax=Candidatus Synechococcus calcipolaris G9 TaxID=1497997 RepID=A0ABT6EXX4_9SYNE|nr:hypothetical protein [Candidatus Synechococcus calcipolaris]MDG2989943.1 hypothetical protein [Candidatus Synechococcus calcipolaris G9]